jgi:hypothetical protein
LKAIKSYSWSPQSQASRNNWRVFCSDWIIHIILLLHALITNERQKHWKLISTTLTNRVLSSFLSWLFQFTVTVFSVTDILATYVLCYFSKNLGSEYCGKQQY